MRLYRNLVTAAIPALDNILIRQQLADRVVPRLLRSNKKWGSKDRRFLAYTIYEVVRWYRLYYEILGTQPQNKADWWQLLGIHWLVEGEDLPPWEQFEGLDKTAILARYETLKENRAIAHAVPDWLDQLGHQALGEQWAPCLAASNQIAPLTLRANTLKTTREDLVGHLDKKGIQALLVSELPDALEVPKRQKLTQLPSYERGYFEIQDGASQQVAPFLQAAADMTVVDACAGAGGKSLHLAALMQNKGQLIALDVESRKLKELQKRAKRAAVSILNTQLIEDKQTIEALHNTADRLLLDVPCSGLGTLRRSPQIKWRLQPDFLQKIQGTQQKILQEYSPICKVGGLLVYATCSILPSENQEQVQQFLKSPAGAAFELLNEQQLWPQDGGDGFYMALLRRG
ncbi:MAG: RsmB/NOP family class I SAM-dependent RNA methyltransferase [Aureispira sp.]